MRMHAFVVILLFIQMDQRIKALEGMQSALEGILYGETAFQ